MSDESRCEELFARWVDEGHDPASTDLDGLCARHPELADGLRRLAENWITIHAGLRDEVDSPDTVDLTAARPASGAWDALIAQLRSRGPSYERYTFEGEIARGGMGVIHRVYDHDARRRLALKVMLGRGPLDATGETPAVDDASLGRFLEEAQVTSQLDHPGIVPVHEIGVDDADQVYFTMKLVKGEDLRTVFAKVSDPDDVEWTLTRALNVMLRVCEAMAYAHEKGVIHRDLKPANVMLGKFGEAYVMDWGLARVLGRDDTHDIRIRPSDSTLLRSPRADAESTPDSPILTMDGAVVGTPAYMPPEQAKGLVDQIGPTADVYAAGAMLYHLVSGSMPYVEPGDHVSARTILAMVLQGPPKPLSDVSRSIPDELVAIVDKAMRREPTARYPDMNALAKDLRAYLENRVVAAHQVGAWAELRKWTKRNRALAATIMVALLSVASLVTWSNLSIRYERDIAAARDRDANHERARAEQSAAELHAAEYFETIRRASTQASTLKHLAGAAGDMRGFEYFYLRARLQESTHRLSHGSAVTRIALDARSDRFFTAGRDGSLLRWSMNGDGPTTLAGHDDSINVLELSPDGRSLVTGDTSGLLRLWDADTGGLIASSPHHTQPIADIAFAPNSEFFLTSGSERVITTWARRSPTQPMQSIPIAETGVLLAFHPSGEILASWGGEFGGFVTIYQMPWLPQVQEQVLKLGVDTAAAKAAVALAALTHGGLKPVEPFVGTEGVRFTDLRFSPDGDYLVATGDGGQASAWDFTAFAAPKEGERIPPLYSNSAARLGYQFAVPHGSDVRIFAPNGPVGEPYRGHPGRVVAAEIHPTTNRLVSADEAGEILLWDLDRSRAFETIQPSPDPIHAVSVSPDGRLALAHAAMANARLVDLETGDNHHVPTATVWAHGPMSGFLHGGEYFVLGDYTSSMEIWHTATRTRVLREGGERFDWWVVATEGRGDRVARCLKDGGVEIFAVAADTSADPDAAPPRVETRTIARCPPQGSAVRAMTFSPDGDSLAVGYESGGVVLWDSGNGQLLRAWSAGGPVTALAFSPDGASLVAGSGDGRVDLWSAETGAPVGAGRWETRVGQPTGIRFAGAERVVTASERGAVQLWNTVDGALILTLGGDQDLIQSIDIDARGEVLIAGGLSRRLLVWRAPRDG